jgi:plastocyanin
MTHRTTTKFHSLGLALAATVCAGTAMACSHPASAPAAAPAPKDSAAVHTASADSMGHAAAADTAATRPPDSTSSPAPAAAPAAAAADTQYLKFDAATNTVTFLLVAGPFNFDGYTSGGATLTVPPRSANVINFEQNDGTPHSAEIDAGTGPLPSSGGNPAIPRAYTNKVVEGLPQGAKDVMRFTAPDSGTYRIICGVPGHALSGMWVWYKVDPSAKTPSFGPTPK